MQLQSIFVKTMWICILNNKKMVKMQKNITKDII